MVGCGFVLGPSLKELTWTSLVCKLDFPPFDSSLRWAGLGAHKIEVARHAGVCGGVVCRATERTHEKQLRDVLKGLRT
jgi:hypothetical protein